VRGDDRGRTRRPAQERYPAPRAVTLGFWTSYRLLVVRKPPRRSAANRFARGKGPRGLLSTTEGGERGPARRAGCESPRGMWRKLPFSGRGRSLFCRECSRTVESGHLGGLRFFRESCGWPAAFQSAGATDRRGRSISGGWLPSNTSQPRPSARVMHADSSIRGAGPTARVPPAQNGFTASWPGATAGRPTPRRITGASSRRVVSWAKVWLASAGIQPDQGRPETGRRAAARECAALPKPGRQQDHPGQKPNE